MKIVLMSGNYEINPIITLKYLETKNIPFYIYREDYSFDNDEEKYVFVPKEEHNTLCGGYIGLGGDYLYVLESYIGSETTEYKDVCNEIYLDLDKIRFDKDFIKIVEENETYNLSVKEILDGTKYKLDWGYSGYDDESYEKIEIYKEEEWKIAE